MKPLRLSLLESNTPAPENRRGVMLVLASVAIVMLLAMAAVSVDVSFMQLTRTELRVAADAASKAGVEALQRTQDPNAAIQAAIDMAALNTVAGRPLILTANDIELGSARLQTDGSWAFEANATPLNSLRVTATMSNDNANGAVPLFLAGLFGTDSFTPTKVSTASNMQQDIYLVIDRSHSMCFDLSGVDWQYPPGTKMTPHPIVNPPHPVHSRWGVLVKSVKRYLDIAQQSSPKPRVGLITWGSQIGTNTAEYYYTHQTEVAVRRDQVFTTQYGNIRSQISGRSEKVMLGGTHMSAGMYEAFNALDDANPLARKIMILMTDGQWNVGENPVDVAAIAKQRGIIIHTITFLPGAEQTAMEQVAQLTGGQHYHAEDAAELEAIFEELAMTMPVVLID
ncbi:MAG: VWA domain-containing protein [Planctomycetaceae bacterium]|nr:VWA domain-containing protein [Planctomycetaceae bacterium]